EPVERDAAAGEEARVLLGKVVAHDGDQLDRREVRRRRREERRRAAEHLLVALAARLDGVERDRADHHQSLVVVLQRFARHHALLQYLPMIASRRARSTGPMRSGAVITACCAALLHGHSRSAGMRATAPRMIDFASSTFCRTIAITASTVTSS